MTSTPLRIAFVGAGQMARQHLNALARLKTPAVPAGVYDPATDAARRFAADAGTRAFGSMEELLASVRPDVVHVCTPPSAHVDAARAALDAGAHVYVEKPFALRTADAGSLLDAAVARGSLDVRERGAPGRRVAPPTGS